VGVNEEESGTMAFRTVTFSEVNVPVQSMVVKSLYVTVPPALLKAPVRVAVSWTSVPVTTVVLVMSVPEASFTFVAMVGLKKTAELARARSCEPTPLWLTPLEVRLSWAMWYGDPLIALAELPTSQFTTLAM
jgi:hypothetical protein